MLRYVEIDFVLRTVEVKESFICFLEMDAHNAEGIVKLVITQLQKLGLDIKRCTSQCYDKANVMAGAKSGVQTRMRNINPVMMFVNCTNHSLNLVGLASVRVEALMLMFFKTVEAIYVFFSGSTQRWQMMIQALSISFKADSDTRWSAKAEAIKPLILNIDKLIELLQSIVEDDDVNSDTKAGALSLLSRICDFSFFTLLKFWSNALPVFDRAQKRLQCKTLTLKEAAIELKVVLEAFTEGRDNLTETSISYGEEMCAKHNVSIETRMRLARGLTVKQKHSQVIRSSIDQIISEIDERFKRLNELDTKFGFLLNVKNLFDPKTDIKTFEDEFKGLKETYSNEFDGDELLNELLDLQRLLKVRGSSITEPIQVLKFIVQYGDESVFPNIRLVYQLILSIAISVASCERSFSKLKLILNYLRSTMGEQRLNNLGLLSIEREEFDSIDFEDVIEEFAKRKARKINL